VQIKADEKNLDKFEMQQNIKNKKAKATSRNAEKSFEKH
jgi:hypothetical protein